MSALWTSAEAVTATGGQSNTDWQANGVSIDTRTLVPGNLFVALKDIRDGHDFVAAALEKGAAAALVSHRPDNISADAPLLIVDDVLDGLAALGRAARIRTNAKVIGVTGSAGKTSTKEMLRTVLSAFGKVHAAEKSFNNHWGVPLTLARMPADTDFAVIEIGMNHPGEIAPLAQMADLDIAIITNVAPVHLAAFTGVDQIAHEKATIFQGLKSDGVAIYNDALETSDILRVAARRFTAKGFGQGDAALLSTDVADGRTKVTAQIGGKILSFTLSVEGKHFAENALAVLLTATALDLDLMKAAKALESWRPPAGRGERWDIDGITLIDDAYNANPLSVGAALDVLATATGTRRIALLGDMLELGATEAQLHAGLADHSAIKSIDIIHCVGPRMKALYDALPPEKRGLWMATSAEMTSTLAQNLHKGDVVLVKGSLGAKMGLLVDAIKSMGTARPMNGDPS